MKTEHTKEFNVEHAKQGAPYCQRNGLAARIGIWDSKSSYPLVGVAAHSLGYLEYSSSWSSVGVSSRIDMGTDLVMLPLGYCDGRPVFVGDELIYNRAIHIAHPKDTNFNGCKWPRTKPVMPTFFDRLGDQFAIDSAITNLRPEIEAYWKALDEYKAGEMK